MFCWTVYVTIKYDVNRKTRKLTFTNLLTVAALTEFIELKICMLAYKSFSINGPVYISDMLQPVSTIQCKTNLHSATNSNLLIQYTTRLRLGKSF